MAAEIPDGLEWLEPTYAELRNESERGCVLVACSRMDKLLVKALRAKFRTLSKINSAELSDLLDKSDLSPLKRFSYRAKVAYALGLIDRQTHQAIHAARDMRNDAAHEPQVIGFSQYPWAAYLESVGPKYLKALRAIHADRLKGMSEVRRDFIIVSLVIMLRLDTAQRFPILGTARLKEYEEADES